MPTASTSMIEKLVSDAGTIKSAIAKFKTHVAKGDDDAPSKAMTEKLDAAFQKIWPQVEKFGREAQMKPPINAEEEDYKARRKDVTALIAVTAKVAKVVKEEEAEAKNGIVIKAVDAARDEIVVRDKKMAQALKAVARGDKGRAGPKEDGVPEYNHIHIGGNAKWNLLFQPAKKLILGTIDFHIDSDNSKSQKEKVKKVAKRGGAKIDVVVNGDDITVKA